MKAVVRQSMILEDNMNYLKSTNTKETWTVRENTLSKLRDIGVKSLTDNELVYLSVIDTPNLFSNLVAESILDAFYTSTSTDDLLKQLASIDSIPKDEINKLIAMAEFVRRHQELNKKAITHPSDIYNLIKHLYSDEQEKFITIGLNGANEPVYKKIITAGLINQTLVHPREVFSDAVSSRCTSIIIAHNHPSHRLIPSKEDLVTTQRIKLSGELLGITLLDHLIFSDTGYYSFNEHEVL